MLHHRKRGHLVFAAGLRDPIVESRAVQQLVWPMPDLAGFSGRHLVLAEFGCVLGRHQVREIGRKRMTFIRFVDVMLDA
jgi:hypothetical protein